MMKSVIANRSFGSLLTKGISYRVVRLHGGNYIVIDNDGAEVGFNKSWFDEPEIFDPSEFAMSIVKLMLFPKSKGYTDEDIVRAKASAILVTEVCKRNCESESDIEIVNQITEAIDKIQIDIE